MFVLGFYCWTVTNTPIYFLSGFLLLDSNKHTNLLLPGFLLLNSNKHTNLLFSVLTFTAGQ